MSFSKSLSAFLLFWVLSIPWGALSSPFERALEATVRLTANGVSGTGFLVTKDGEWYLVTAAHVFGDLKGDKCDLVYRKKNEKGNPVRAVTPLTIRAEEKPLWRKHEKFDLAVIACDLPEDSAMKPFELERLATAEEMEAGLCGVGAEVCIPCYPIGTEANPAGWPILRRGTIATHPLAPVSEAENFFIDSSSFGGESGAPVVFWKADEWHVIGIVTSMQRQTDRTVTPLEERVSHLPLGLGIAVQSAFLFDLLEGE
jgi:hypothetical protein